MKKFKDGLGICGTWYMTFVLCTFGLGFLLLPIALPLILIGGVIYAITN